MSCFTKVSRDMTPRFRIALTVLAALFAASLLAPGPSAQARPQYKSSFTSKYKQYYKDKKFTCLLCHEKKSDGKTDTKKRKSYGKAVGKHLSKKNVKKKKDIDEVLTKAEDEDSAIKDKTFGDLIRMGLDPNSKPKKKE
jgi:gas vesicle protein